MRLWVVVPVAMRWHIEQRTELAVKGPSGSTLSVWMKFTKERSACLCKSDRAWKVCNLFFTVGRVSGSC